jgi:anti-sigma-K factor RskA
MSDALPERDADKALAGEYALGLLPPDEAVAFEARLASEPQLRALYADWAEDLARLTDRIDPVAPPPQIWAGTEERLFGSRGRVRPSAAWSGGWLGTLMGGITATVLVLALIVGADLMQRGPSGPSDPAYVAELVSEERNLILFAAYDAQQGTLFVERQSGAPAQDRALELWLLAGSDAPVSLGVLPDARAGVIDIPEALRPRLEGAALAVSDEPEGGSPTGAPTGAVLAVAQITNT